MIKMQVFLREEQKAALRKMAARTGTVESDLVRQGVDLMLQKNSEDGGDWKKAALAPKSASCMSITVTDAVRYLHRD